MLDSIKTALAGGADALTSLIARIPGFVADLVSAVNNVASDLSDTVVNLLGGVADFLRRVEEALDQAFTGE